MTHESRLCKHCSVSFIPWRETSRYCSRQCSTAVKTKHLPKPCRSCHRPFKPRYPTANYCCLKCRQTHLGHLKKDRSLTADKGVERARKAADLLEYAPRYPADVAEWLGKLTDEQVLTVWIPLVVEQFGAEGQRASLSAALCEVRTRITRVRHAIRMAG